MTPADLVEIELIKRLKYKYMRCLDQKLWDEIGDCFTDDAVASYSGGKYAFEGREAIVAFFRASMSSPSFLSSHRVHHPEIDLTSPTTATGTWALEDVVIDPERDFALRGAAFYTDDYVKTADGWRIARTAYKRSFEEVWSRSQPGPHRLTASWWATDGQSQLPIPEHVAKLPRSSRKR
ncbi:MAG TPA: nuclear transport factor 2 family protein [Candidatus Binatia bacterium]|nr:nuclear transport factor 2 family protein [Candidatus Binatia bacterium]